MKKIYVTVSLAVAVSLAAAAQSKFDGPSVSAVNHYLDVKANPSATLIQPVELPFTISHTARGAEAEAGVIITLNEGASFDAIEAAGLKIEARIGNDMCVAIGSMDDIIALEDNDAVKSLSFGRQAFPMLNKARSESSVVEVHEGTGLPQAYKGTGVVCGIYDSGIDPNHINFYDAAFTGSRVKAVYHCSGSGGGSKDYDTPEKIAGFTTDSKSGTHGTHTLGCMTGAFCLKGNSAASTGRPTGKTALLNAAETSCTVLSSNAVPYYGTAPDADILIGCGQLYDANMIAAVGKIVDYAKAHNQPCVVNLSIGSNAGPHDGSDSFGQAMQRLGEYAIICISSGNEGEENISISKTFTGSDKSLKTCLNFPQNGQGVLDIYGSDRNKFTFSVAIIDKTTGQVIFTKEYNTVGSKYLTTSNYTVSTYDHAAEFDAAFANSFLNISISDNETTTGRHSVSIQYNLNASAKNSSRNQVIALFIDGNAGQRIDITNRNVSGNVYMSSNNLSGYSDASPEFSINSMACGKNVLAIGSWTSRIKWPTVSRSVYYYTADANLPLNEVSPFTSYGVTYDGRSLPDICAPGAGIISSYNSYYNRDSGLDVAVFNYKDREYVWQIEQGTSMASPFAAGVVATWLQAKPDLTVDQVRDIMKKTAKPLNGGNAVQRGAGKLDAYAGLKEVLNMGAVNDIVIESDILFSSKGGNVFEAFVPGGNVSVTVYNISGQPVMNAHTSDTTLDVDLSSQAKGIYLVNINGAQTHRVAVN